ncbi:carboxypeptidase-like regulatory domain-containing protein [Formosa haliotis]|uniref:carboxypeptidase-like regulatory domain-containing protein n=1 Tax=Formosa haliotis TaxID=1555194 RepID=UPI000A5D2C01|nr:carboxypeptidase-like regulatory domain-containing protein [Formosa haliotis]
MQFKIIILSVLFFLLNIIRIQAQTVNIQGNVTGVDDLENIHVINKTSQTYTITNAIGEFEISGKLNDTLVFSAIQYIGVEVLIDETVLINKTLTVNLQEHVNTLDEVIVGKILTGDLLLDVGNSTAEPEINFYDVGIPGYQGKRRTQPERRLHEAQTGGGFIPLNPILNGISGRTKMLKQHVAFERNDALVTKIKQRYAEHFFKEHPLDESKQMDFLYFCSDDPNFMKRCKGKNDIEIEMYLKEKYVQYLNNINGN